MRGLALLLLAGCDLVFPLRDPPIDPIDIAFIQVSAAAPTTASQAITIVYPGAQTPGNLNVVVVGWSDASQDVVTVIDTNGNPYRVAAAKTTGSTVAAQAIYYASAIRSATAGGNSVIVTFTNPVFPDIRIAEYGGIVNDPFDVASSMVGFSAALDSGQVTPRSAPELLVAATTACVASVTLDDSFEIRARSPAGNLVADLVVDEIASYRATGSLNAADDCWVLQLVTFRGR